MNIFENASKYSYENTPIKIDVKEEEFYVVITVTNEADYVPKEKLNKLFDKFTRLNTAKTNSISGTGLGLFIVKGLVESMGGNITLRSDDEYGFSAIIELNTGTDE